MVSIDDRDSPHSQVSKAYVTVYDILMGKVEAATAVARLEIELAEITGFNVATTQLRK